MSAKYEYKVTAFEAKVLDTDKNKAGKIRGQLQDQFEEYSDDGWEFDSQLTFSYKVGATGCFGKKTGKVESEHVIYQLVFRREI